MIKALHIVLFGLLALCGCGEVNILAIDRSKVVNAHDAADSRDADAAEVEVPSGGIYLEAESGRLSGGFTIGNDDSASGGQFIAPPTGVTSTDQPGAARALYAVQITTPGTYTIWGRIQSPDLGHNRFWAQVDGDSWYLWYITTGEIWYWNRVHNRTDYYTRLTFELAAGSHQLLFANAVDGVRLDRLYLTPSRDTPPGNDTPCRPPNSIQVDGGCIPSCGSLMGNTCGVPQCMGRPVLGPVYDCQVCCFVPAP